MSRWLPSLAKRLKRRPRDEFRRAMMNAGLCLLCEAWFPFDPTTSVPLCPSGHVLELQ